MEGTCYERRKEKLKEYAKKWYHPEDRKVKTRNTIILTRQDFKNSHKIIIKIFEMKNKKRKDNTQRIDIEIWLNKIN